MGHLIFLFLDILFFFQLLFFIYLIIQANLLNFKFIFLIQEASFILIKIVLTLHLVQDLAFS